MPGENDSSSAQRVLNTALGRQSTAPDLSAADNAGQIHYNVSDPLSGLLGGETSDNQIDPAIHAIDAMAASGDHSTCVICQKAGWRDPATFVSSIKEDKFHMHGMESKPLNYTKRSTADKNALRAAFGRDIKSEWLMKTAKEKGQDLKNAKLLDDEDLRRMSEGKNPEGYDVHHIEPLDDSGDNDPSNFILMRKSKEHSLLTNYQNKHTRSLKPGESKLLNWPYPPKGAVIWPQTEDQVATPTDDSADEK